MKTHPLTRFFHVTIATLVLAAATHNSSAQLQSLYRDDDTSFLSQLGAWKTNSGGVLIDAAAVPNLNVLTIFSNNIAATNLSNTISPTLLPVTAAWGGIRVMDTVAPVNIKWSTNDVSPIRTHALGLMVEGNDLIIEPLYQANVAAQRWNIAPGRLLTFPIISNNTAFVHRDVALNGAIMLDRPLSIRSNAVFSMTNETVGTTNTIPHIRTTTNSLAQFIVGAAPVISGATVVHTVGTNQLLSSNVVNVLVVGNSRSNTVAYHLGGSGVVDARSHPDQFLAIPQVTRGTIIGNDSNSFTVLNMSNNAQFYADNMSVGVGLTNSTSVVSIAGSSFVQARNFTNGYRSVGQVTITNSGSLTVSNNIQFSGNNTAASGTGTLDLWGGTLNVPGITRGGGNNATLNFRGGTLVMTTNSTAFATATVLFNIGSNAPAIIDTGTNLVTNTAPLLHATGGDPDAGMIKLGTGTLTQRGANTIQGTVVVSNGTFATDTSTWNGRAGITLAAATSWNLRRIIGTPTITNAAITAGTGTAINIDLLLNGSPTVPLIVASNLTVAGTLTLNLTGFNLTPGLFTVIDYDAASGTNLVVLGTLPAGVEGNLVYDSVLSRIDLNITGTPRTIFWNGIVSGSWEAGGPTNWFNVGISDGDFFKQGDRVAFDDTAAGTRSITLNTNAQVNVDLTDLRIDNSAGDYSLTGTGALSGPFRLIKDGTGVFTMGLPPLSNNYTGDLLISNGTYRLGANENIPHGAGFSNVSMTAPGTLDLNGNTEAVNGFYGSGTVDNTSGSPATLVIGTNGVGGTNDLTVGLQLLTGVGIFSGNISNTGAGPLSFWKAGGGQTVLTGTNSHTGGTTIIGGTLRVNDQRQLGSTNNPLTLGATLAVTNGAITNNATLTLRANSTLTVTNGGSAHFSGPIFSTNSVINPTTGFNLVMNGGGLVTFTNSVGKVATWVMDHGTAVFKDTIITNTAFVAVGRGALANATVIADGATFISTNAAGAMDFNVADTVSATGTLHITNNSTFLVNNFWVGKSLTTTGTVYQSSGSVTSFVTTGTAFRIGGQAAADSNALGTWNLSGGRIDLIKAFQIGALGNGTLNISGGEANVWSNTVSIGLVGLAVGNLNVTGGSFNNRSNGGFFIGNGGRGTLTVSNGGLVTAVGTVTLANSNTTGVGVLNLGLGGTMRVGRLTGGTSTNRLINFDGGTLEPMGSTNNFVSGVGLTNIFIQPGGGYINTSNYDITISNAFRGSGNLVKQGTGILVLASTNSPDNHTGGTIVSNGTLYVTPTYRSFSTITADDLGGFGVRINTALNTTAELGNVNVSTTGGGKLAFDLGVTGNPSNTVMHVASLTINGPSTIDVTGFNLRVSPVPIVLVDYDSIGGLGTNGITLGTLPIGVNAHLEYNGPNTRIELVIDSIDATVWNGTTDNVWDIGTTVNWKLVGADVTYGEGAVVRFTDTVTGPGGTSLIVASNVTPGSVTFTNVTSNYTLNGPGAIIGSGSLFKQGAGIATLAAVSNDYTGNTIISAGTLRLGTNDALPHGAGRSNITVNAGSTFNLNGFSEKINGLEGAGTVNNSGAGVAVLTVGLTNGEAAFSGVVQNTGAPLTMVKVATGTNTLSGPNTYSGGTHIIQGRLVVGHNTALGTGTNLMGDLATLASVGSVTLANSFAVTNVGTFATLNTDGGNITLTGTNRWAGPTAMVVRGSNTLTFGPGSVTTMGTQSGIRVSNGTFVVDGGTVTFTNTGVSTFTSPLLSGTNAAIELKGGGTMNLASGSQLVLGFLGNTTLTTPSLLNTFTLTSGTLNMGNEGIYVGNNNGNTGVFNQNGGTLTSTNPGNTLGVRMVNNASNTLGIYNLNGGTLIASRVFKNGTQPRSFARFNFNGGTLQALNSLNAGGFIAGFDEVLISAPGAIIDTTTNFVTATVPFIHNSNSVGGGLTKLGVGTLVLSGNGHAYTNDTIVSNGTLMFNFPYTGRSVIRVADGAGFGARFTAASLPAQVDNAIVGTNTGASMTFDLGAFANTSNSPVRVTNLTVSGTTTVNVIATNLTVGTYKLLDYVNLTGTLTLATGTLPPGIAGIVSNNVTDTTIDLIVTGVTPFYWTGLISTAWDSTAVTNWLFNGQGTNFTNGAHVIIDDSATATTINIADTNHVFPSSVIVSNPTKNFTLTGISNRILGSGALIKRGAGMLSIYMTNDYTGASSFLEGTVRMLTNDVIPNGGGRSNLTLNGTLDMNGNTDTINGLDGTGTIANTGGTNVLTIGANNASGSFSGAITDAGGDLLIIKTGTGSNALLGASTFSGGFRITAGILQAGHDSALGTGTNILSAGGTLAAIGGTRTIANPIGTTTNVGVATLNTDLGELVLNGVVNWSGPEMAINGSNVFRVGATGNVTLGLNSGVDLNNGAFVLDGGTWTHVNDGFRVNASPAAPLLQVSVLSGTLDIGGSSNLALGALTNSAATTNTAPVSLLNINAGSGLVRIGDGAIMVGFGAGNIATVNQNGGTVSSTNLANNNGVRLGDDAETIGTYNLNGGTLRTARVRKTGPTNSHARFFFNGGTLAPLNLLSAGTLMQGLDVAFVSAGGAFIDTRTNLSDTNPLTRITVNQSLQANGGGLTKLGAGFLILGGSNNTYTGDTVVGEGTLMVNFPYNGVSTNQITNGATFAARITNPTNPPAGVHAVKFNGPSNNFLVELAGFSTPLGPVVVVTNLSGTGDIVVALTGTGALPLGQFTLIDYTTLGGTPNFVLGTNFPRSVTASIVTNLGNTSIDLNISAITPLYWAGGPSDLQTNWVVFTNLFTPENWLLNATSTYYLDGEYAIFDDSASITTVTLSNNVSPGGVIISNVVNTYIFRGANDIVGSGYVIKRGAGLVELGADWNNTGVTRIEEGTVQLMAANPMRNGAGSSNLFIGTGAVYEMNGFNDTVMGPDVAVGGSVSNNSSTNSVWTIGSDGSSGRVAGVISASLGTNLIVAKAGAGTNAFTSANLYSGETRINGGTLQLGNNGAFGTGTNVLANGGTFGTTNGTRTFANPITTTATAGDVNFDTTYGDLTLTGPVSSLLPDLNKIGTGLLTFGASSVINLETSSEFAVFGGDVNVAGIMTITNDGFRLRATTNFPLVSASITGSGAVTLRGGANFVVGASGDANVLTASLSNVFTLAAGNLNVSNGGIFIANGTANAGVFNHNGGSVTFLYFTNAVGVGLAGASNTLGIYNLNGGTLTTPYVRKIADATVSNAIAIFNFNGGTLRALTSFSNDAAIFLQGLDTAMISVAGATIDVDTNNITINQPLSENPLSTLGGLTKNGASNLTLTATNTYTGQTVVNAGNLILPSTYAGASTAINVVAGGLVARRTIANAASTASAVTFIAGSVLEVDLGNFGNSATPVITTTAFDASSGPVGVSVSGFNLAVGTIPLVQYTSVAFFGNLSLISLPPGVVASLNTNLGNTMIELVVSAVNPLTWTGNTSTNWDHVSTNWVLMGTNLPFLQPAETLFDESGANTAITLVSNFLPGHVTISNSATPYSFTGISNRITGTTGLTKIGSGTATMGITNDYTGTTLIGGGSLRLGTNQVILSTAAAGPVIITNSGVLDLNGYIQRLRLVSGNGTIDNTSTTNGTLIFAPNAAAGPVEFAGLIRDTVADLIVVKTNAGTNILSTANTWSGGTVLVQGEMAAGHNEAFGNGPITGLGGTLATVNGARSISNALNTFTQVGNWLGTGLDYLNVDNGGEFDLRTDGGNLTLTGNLTAREADINKVGSNTLTIGSAAVWQLGNGELGVFGGSIVIDGASVTTTNGFRMYATTNFPTLTVTLQNSGTINSAGNFILGRNADTNMVGAVLTNTFNLNSGQILIRNTASIIIPNDIGNYGELNQNAGNVTFVDPTTGGVQFAAATNSTGVYNLNAGTLKTTRIIKTGTNVSFARFVFGGGTLEALDSANATNFMSGLDEALIRAVGARIDTAGANIMVGQNLTPDTNSLGGGLVKLGAGTLHLNGTNTYTGATIVSNGTLAGTGIIASPVTIAAGGLISAGNSIGTLTINNTLTIVGGARMEINKAGITNTADKVAGMTALTYGGTLTVTHTGDALLAGDSFDLFDSIGSPTGSFSSTNLPALGGGLSWNFDTASGVLSVVSGFTPNVEITGFNVVGGTNLNLVGSGGPPNGTNFVRTTNDMNIPLASWTIIMTNVFDGSGNFNFVITNAITGETNRFYRVVLP